LARVSLIRTSSNDEPGIELEDQRHQSPSPDSHRQSLSKAGPSRGP
jgi:chitin synthase